MISSIIDKILIFVRSNRDILIVLSLLLGLYSTYQNWSEKQVKWVDGWSCSYWDAQRNSSQTLMDNILGASINGQEFNYELWSNYKEERDSAAEKFNKNCLSPSSYFME